MANDTAVKKAAARKAQAKKTAKKASPAMAARAPQPPPPPPGWYADPAEPDVQRYWDGDGWDAAKGARGLDGEPIPPATPAPVDPAAAGDGGAPVPSGTITFRGRVMAYRKPTPDQLAVWKMIADRGQALAKDLANPQPCPTCQGSGCEECDQTGSGHTVTILRLFKRTMTIISSVLVDEVDRDWIEDEMIAGRIQLVDASQIVNLTVQQMIADQPRQAPRNGPVAKARRRR